MQSTRAGDWRYCYIAVSIELQAHASYLRYSNRDEATRMRFSLGTLLLLVLWIALGMAVWAYRDPWQLRNTVPRELKPARDEPLLAPDGRRFLTSPPWGGGPLFVVEVAPGTVSKDTLFVDYTENVLFKFKDSISPRDCTFIDDDTIGFVHMEWPMSGAEPVWIETAYHRRFPEWWWGHFYRVEVWLFTLVTVVLVFRGYNFLQNRRPAVSSPLQIAGALNCVSRS